MRRFFYRCFQLKKRHILVTPIYLLTNRLTVTNRRKIIWGEAIASRHVPNRAICEVNYGSDEH